MALLFFTSFFLNRNCRFRLDKSMVSRSSSVMCPKPVKTRFFTSRANTVGQLMKGVRAQRGEERRIR